MYWRAFQFYVPLWLAIVFNSYVYLRVIRLLRRTVGVSGPGDPLATKMLRVIQRLQWFPLILLIVWVPATVNRIYETASGGNMIFWLFLLQRCFSSSQGLLNAVAYGSNESVRAAFAADIFAPCARRLGCTAAALWLSRGGAGGGGASTPGGGGGLHSRGDGSGGLDDAESESLAAPDTPVGRGYAPSETTAVLVSPPPGLRTAVDTRPVLSATDKAPSPVKTGGSSAYSSGGGGGQGGVAVLDWGRGRTTGPAKGPKSSPSQATGGGGGDDAFAAAHAIPTPPKRSGKKQGGRRVADITTDDDDEDDDEEG